MTNFSSVIQSVTTDRNFLSVVTDWIMDGKVFELLKKAGRWCGGFGGLYFLTESPTDSKRQPVQWRDRFTVWIADGLTEGFEMADPYGDVSIFPSESPTWSPTKIPSVKPSEKVNIWQLCRPSPPLFLLLLPNPNSLHLQTTSPPSPLKKKNLPHISTTSYISWSFVVTSSVFWFTNRFYQFL